MNMQDHLISIVIPVYNVEKYLDRCINSVVNQTYKNLEIILVDDGSPDNCPNICDTWEKKDERIRVIHKDNGGLSDARNVGVEAATGEYIAFVDSDDWVDAEMLEKLIDRMISTDSDIVSCDAVRVWDDDTLNCTMIKASGDFVLDKIEAISALIQSSCLIQTVWNKLYKASLVKRVPFEKGKIHEDEFWSWQVIASASRVATIKDILYYYYQRSESIMGSGYTGFPTLVVQAKLQRHEYISRELPELSDLDSRNLLDTCYYQGTQIIKHEKGPLKKEYFRELQKALTSCEFSAEYLSKLNPAKRLQISFIQRHLKTACLIAVLRGVE